MEPNAQFFFTCASTNRTGANFAELEVANPLPGRTVAAKVRRA